MLTPYHFFLRHAGYSYDPKTQTPMQGRMQCAQQMAAAEGLYLDAHRHADVWVSWGPDADGWADHAADKRAGRTEGADPEQIEFATILHRDADDRVHCLASLHGIYDADDNYRRVIRAELAAECADALRGILGSAA